MVRRLLSGSSSARPAGWSRVVLPGGGPLGAVRLLGLLAVGRGLANRLHQIRQGDGANQEGERK
jgi:hypothetical protein